MKRPDRQNYPIGAFGDISYDDQLERYCSYLENQNKRLVKEILKITNESPYGRLDMDSTEAREICKLLNKNIIKD